MNGLELSTTGELSTGVVDLGWRIHPSCPIVDACGPKCASLASYPLRPSSCCWRRSLSCSPVGCHRRGRPGRMRRRPRRSRPSVCPGRSIRRSGWSGASSVRLRTGRPVTGASTSRRRPGRSCAPPPTVWCGSPGRSAGRRSSASPTPRSSGPPTSRWCPPCGPGRRSGAGRSSHACRPGTRAVRRRPACTGVSCAAASTSIRSPPSGRGGCVCCPVPSGGPAGAGQASE